jgi:hypothetical protein
MNQKSGIKSVRVRKYPRHSTKDKFSNIGNISGYLQALQLSKEKLNSPQRLKEMGFHEKDLPLIHDLVNLYQDEEKKQKLRNEPKRNTIAYNVRAPKIDEVQENFSEEKYSDGSFASDPEDNLENQENYDTSSLNGDQLEPNVFNEEELAPESQKIISKSRNDNTNINNTIISNAASDFVIQQNDLNYKPQPDD